MRDPYACTVIFALIGLCRRNAASVRTEAYVLGGSVIASSACGENPRLLRGCLQPVA